MSPRRKDSDWTRLVTRCASWDPVRGFFDLVIAPRRRPTRVLVNRHWPARKREDVKRDDPDNGDSHHIFGGATYAENPVANKCTKRAGEWFGVKYILSRAGGVGDNFETAADAPTSAVLRLPPGKRVNVLNPGLEFGSKNEQ
jgi:hypothetical protein